MLVKDDFGEKDENASSPLLRLGLSGNFKLSKNLIDIARLYNVGIKRIGADEYRLIYDETHPLADILPQNESGETILDFKSLKNVLERLQNPVQHIAQSIGKQKLSLDQGKLAKMDQRADTEGLSKEALRDQLNDILDVSRQQEGAKVFADLSDALRFSVQGYVHEEKQNHHHHYHDDDDDEDLCCDDHEAVDSMLEHSTVGQANGEVNGGLTKGFVYDRKQGGYRLSLNANVVSQTFGDPHSKQFAEIIMLALHEATEQRYIGTDPLDNIVLSPTELEFFSRLMSNHLELVPTLIKDVYAHETLSKHMGNIRHTAHHFYHDDNINQIFALKPDQSSEEGATQRLQTLKAATAAFKDLVSNSDIQSIWQKHNVTKKFEGSSVHLFLERLDIMAQVMDAVEEGDVYQLEALSAEFRDLLAGSRLFLDSVKCDLSFLDDDTPFIQALRTLDEAFDQASLSGIHVAENKIKNKSSDVAYFLRRETGAEGVSLKRLYQDFVEGFGGEIFDFVKRHPILTAGMAVSVHFLMNAGNAAPSADAVSASDSLFGDASASADASSSGQGVLVFGPDGSLVFEEVSQDEIVSAYGDQENKICHLHVPSFIADAFPDDIREQYRLDHCFFSDQTAVYLRDTGELAYGALKAPMNAVLDSPGVLVDGVEGSEFAEGFDGSLSTTGDALFAANVYQNFVLHASLFGSMGAMAWKDGVIKTTKKASGLITPVIDMGYSAARAMPATMGGAAAGAVYGFTQQGISGAVAGAVLGGVAGATIGTTAKLAHKSIDHLDIDALNGIKPSKLKADKTLKILENRHAGVSGEGGQGSEPFIEFSVPDGDEKAQNNLLPEGYASRLQMRFGKADIPYLEMPLFQGRQAEFVLNEQTFKNALSDVRETIFMIDHLSDQVGLNGKDGAYKEHVRAKAEKLLQALESFKDDQAQSSSALQAAMCESLPTLVGFQRAHLGHSKLVEAFEGNDQILRSFDIKNAQKRRSLKRAFERAKDGNSLRDIFKNTIQSFKHIKKHPVSIPLSVPFRLLDSLKVGAQFTLGEMWHQTVQGFSHANHAQNRFNPKLKRRLIAAGAAVTAFAVALDISPALQNAVQMLPFGAEQVTGVSDAVAGAAGVAGGASTATGLFTIYNVLEDHLLVHLGMGYAFIIGTGAVKLLYTPVKKTAGLGTTLILDGLSDMSNKDIRKAGRPFSKMSKSLGRAVHKVSHIDEYLAPQH